MFSGFIDGIPTIDGEQSSPGFESGGGRNITVKNTMEIIGSNIGNRLDFDVFGIEGTDENLCLIPGAHDSHANRIRMGEPIPGIKGGGRNGRNPHSEGTAFEKIASGTIAIGGRRR